MGHRQATITELTSHRWSTA